MNAQEFGETLWRASVNDKMDPNQNGLGYSFDWNNNYDNPTLSKVNIAKFLEGAGQAQRTPSADTEWVKKFLDSKVASGLAGNINNIVKEYTDLLATGKKVTAKDVMVIILKNIKIKN